MLRRTYVLDGVCHCNSCTRFQATFALQAVVTSSHVLAESLANVHIYYQKNPKNFCSLNQVLHFHVTLSGPSFLGPALSGRAFSAPPLSDHAWHSNRPCAVSNIGHKIDLVFMHASRSSGADPEKGDWGYIPRRKLAICMCAG